MGLKVHFEMELPLTKAEAEGVMGFAMFAVTQANGAIADLEPERPDQTCGAINPQADPTVDYSVCTYKRDHPGRHRYAHFGPPLEE